MTPAVKKDGFSQEAMLKESIKGAAGQEESYDFEAEVPQVMSIIINSVYSTKELFLRELVSNASDALSKMMAKKAQLDNEGYETVPICNYGIKVIVDEKNRTLTIQDNGIGMTKAELRSFLGSIASSGTKKFREAMEKSNGESNVEALIGQFGLGFYSAFLVAERVDVITKNVQDSGYLWSSDGTNSYTIRPCEVSEPHGTAVILKLKEGEEEYLRADRLTELLKKHSMFVRYRLSLVTEEEEKEEKETENEIDGENATEDGAVEEIKEETDKEEGEKSETPKTKVVEKVINSEVPVWTKKVEEIPEADLKKFYKTLSNDYDDYLAVQSWHFEGIMDLKILLFIPKRPKMNFFENRSNSKSENIHIFNSNVFVTNELDTETVPEWMQFVVGAVSSADFPMNISREFLQGKSAMNLLRTRLPKCIAEMITKLESNEETYKSFYENFALNIKLAVRQYTGTQQETFAKFLRYPTNLDKSKPIGLDAYMEKLPEDAKQILILTGSSKAEVENSIYLEGYENRPVLLMSEAADEIMLQSFKTYRELSIQPISADGVETCGAQDQEEYKALADFIKESMDTQLEKVIIATKAEDIAATLFSAKYAGSGTMENIIRSHAAASNNPMLMMMMNSKKIMEINTASPIIKTLKSLFDQEKKEDVKKYIPLLYQTALIGCGYPIDDKASYVKSVYAMLASAVVNQ